MDIIDFRYRPPYGSYRETIMYRDLERARRCSEAFGMNQSPAVAARDMEASLAEMDRAGDYDFCVTSADKGSDYARVRSVYLRAKTPASPPSSSPITVSKSPSVPSTPTPT